MGKIKRERKKYHMATGGGDKTNVAESERLEDNPLKHPLDVHTDQNIFAGINIQLSDINQFVKAPIVEEAPIVISKSKKSDNKFISNTIQKITKKEKKTKKHQKLLEKLDITQKARLLHRKRQQPLSKQMNAKDQTLWKSSHHKNLCPSNQAAIKSSDRKVSSNYSRNLSSISSLNDGLPALSSAPRFSINDFSVHSKSKSISKTTKKEKICSVRNYNFLMKAMAKK